MQTEYPRSGMHKGLCYSKQIATVKIIMYLNVGEKQRLARLIVYY